MTKHRGERLRFLNIDRSGSSIWWPCVLFDTFQELLKDMDNDKQRAWAVVVRNRLMAPKECSWVHLLGQTRNGYPHLMFVDSNSVDTKVKDFMIHLEDMDGEYSSDGTWMTARGEAIAILEDLIKASSSIDFSSPSGDTYLLLDIEEHGVSSSTMMNGTTKSGVSGVAQKEHGTFSLDDTAADHDENHNTTNMSHQGRKVKVNSKSSKLESKPNKFKQTKLSSSPNQKTETTIKESENTIAESIKTQHQETTIATELENKRSSPRLRSSIDTKDIDRDFETSTKTTPKSKSKQHEETTVTVTENKRSSPRLQSSNNNAKANKVELVSKTIVPHSKAAAETKKRDETAEEGSNRKSSRLQTSQENKGNDEELGNRVSVSRSKASAETKKPVESAEEGSNRKSRRFRSSNDMKGNDGDSANVSSIKSTPKSKQNQETTIVKSAKKRKSPRFNDAQGAGVDHNIEDTMPFASSQDSSGEEDERGIFAKPASRGFSKNDGKLTLESANSKSPTTIQSTKYTNTITPNRADDSKTRIKNVAVSSKGQKRSIKQDDEWTEVMNILIDYGYYYVKSSSAFCDYYWVSGKHSGVEDEQYLRTHLKEYTDYFSGEEQLKAFVHKKYGWVGPAGKEYKPLGRKRSRTSQIDTEKDRNKKPKPTSSKPTASKTEISTAKESLVTKKIHKLPKIDHVDTRNLGERLKECINNLDVSNISEDVLFFGNDLSSKLSTKQESIMNFLDSSVNEKNEKSSLMYVCGNPGMGKTTLVKHCVHNFVKERSSCLELFLNAASLSAVDSIFKEIAKVAGGNGTADSIDNMLCTINKASKKRNIHIILILDEIDFLLKKIGNRKNGEDASAFNTVLAWASDPTYRLTLIGISNSVGNNDARVLHQRTEVGEELIFEPYGVEDLKGIIMKRLGTNAGLVDEKAIEYVTKKIAKNNGDARAVLDLFNKALIVCKNGLSEETLASTTTGASVLTMRHVLQALRSAGFRTQVEVIQALPPKVKILLCIASALNQVSETWKEIPLRTLKSFCNQATDRGIIDETSQETFVDLVTRLEDAGLFCTGEVDEFTSSNQCGHFMDRNIRVGAQLEDVECAIEESLLQNQFYRSIVENVKRKGFL